MKDKGYLPEDPNRGVPLSDLMRKHGGFTAVVEKKDWFDESAKPKNKKKPESEFEPDDTVTEETPDGSV